jgi:hypothetical protein
MQSTLYGVGSVDYFSVAVIAAPLLAVAVFACWVPARRSTRVDRSHGSFATGIGSGALPPRSTPELFEC